MHGEHECEAGSPLWGTNVNVVMLARLGRSEFFYIFCFPASSRCEGERRYKGYTDCLQTIQTNLASRWSAPWDTQKSE